jgi:hypothetical protein
MGLIDLRTFPNSSREAGGRCGNSKKCDFINPFSEQDTSMATQPDTPEPDIIRPQSPPETPAPNFPGEAPYEEPPEIAPEQPDIDFPDSAPIECPGDL